MNNVSLTTLENFVCINQDRNEIFVTSGACTIFGSLFERVFVVLRDCPTILYSSVERFSDLLGALHVAADNLYSHD
jgi:hypothetical protein